MRPSGEDVARLQNQEVNLRIQAAARQRYFRESLLVAGGTGLSLALAIAAIVLAVANSSAGVILAAIAGAWLFVDRLLLQPFANRERRLGAQLQQRYDARVLGVPAKSQSLPDGDLDQDISALSVHRDLQKYRNWYAVPPELQWPDSVALAQLINAAWGARQHRAYASFLFVLVSAVLIGEIAFALSLGLTLAAYLVSLALPSLPFLLQAAEGAGGHLATGRERRAMANHIRTHTDLRDDGQVAVEDNQEHLFSIRSRDPHVPGWFYTLVRAGFARDAKFAAQMFLQDRQGG